MSSLELRNGILCRICLTVAYDREICACGNLGVIIDHDEHLHLYVDNITTSQRVLVYFNGPTEVRREILQSFQESLYAEYTFYDEPYTFRERAPRSYTPKKTSTTYDTSLMRALDKHILHTSDGKEDFQKTATIK